MKVFSDRLKELRLSQGCTQGEIAAQIGTTAQNYSAYENGREPPYEKLVQLAEIFEVTCDYLLDNEDFKTRREAFAYLEGLRVLGISEQLYAGLARLPSFESFLNTVYSYVRTEEDEVLKVNEAFLTAYGMNADMTKFPPIGFFNKDLYYQDAIFWRMRKLDDEYRRYTLKTEDAVSAPDGD